MFDSFFKKDTHKVTVDLITKTLHEFDIEVVVDQVIDGYQVETYYCTITDNKVVNDVSELYRELQLVLTARSILIKPIDSSDKKFSVTIDTKGKKKTFLFSEAIKEFSKSNESSLTVPLGVTISKELYSVDLKSVSSMVVAGVTGSGKSMLFHTIINSLTEQNTPEDLKLVLIDPKRVELTLYHESKYLWAPVEVSPPEAIDLLRKVLLEADKRISDKKTHPHLLIVIDEFSDLMCYEPSETKNVVLEIFRKAKLAGITMIIGTSRPSTDVYPKDLIAAADVIAVGTLASEYDSMHLTGKRDAEMLVGCGDMLVMHKAAKKEERIQVCYISEKEIKDNVKR